MSDIFRFQKFPVYNEAKLFRRKLKDLSSSKFPKQEQYCLLSQLWRALDSILLNIAEGSDRYSDIDFSRFLNNALTSLNEAVACLDCALSDSYINPEEYRNYLLEAESLSKQLKAFSSKVRKSDSKQK
ncbi:MAG: four helix bundle protein [Candidatus Omnitrophica bacterium]|jgi:four helix bundle protein|nr:four helix bundle protein [Candidatus Omnitrophota bacterium]MDD5430418.1 four helix bundle protein [Candidatus Omnitrophota bacterium]